MREIKFRKFLKDWNGKMEYWERGQDHDEMYKTDNFWNDNPREVMYMQYTGLKDKNGKEIYEGDIITHIFVQNQPKEVYFANGGYYAGQVMVSNYHESCLEIIGNIYENPELLNDETLAGGTKASGII